MHHRPWDEETGERDGRSLDDRIAELRAWARLRELSKDDQADLAEFAFWAGYAHGNG